MSENKYYTEEQKRQWDESQARFARNNPEEFARQQETTKGIQEFVANGGLDRARPGDLARERGDVTPAILRESIVRYLNKLTKIIDNTDSFEHDEPWKRLQAKNITLAVHSFFADARPLNFVDAPVIPASQKITAIEAMSVLEQLRQCCLRRERQGEKANKGSGAADIEVATHRTTRLPTPAALRAYSQFREVTDADPNLAKHGNRRAAWKAAKAAAEIEGEEIQSFETWNSHVRTASRAAKSD